MTAEQPGHDHSARGWCRCTPKGTLREALADALWNLYEDPAHTFEKDAELLLADKGVAAALAALATPDRADPPERFDRSWWHYADDCPVPPLAPPPAGNEQ